MLSAELTEDMMYGVEPITLKAVLATKDVEAVTEPIEGMVHSNIQNDFFNIYFAHCLFLSGQEDEFEEFLNEHRFKALIKENDNGDEYVSISKFYEKKEWILVVPGDENNLVRKKGFVPYKLPEFGRQGMIGNTKVIFGVLKTEDMI